ncbi:hypothetical protein B0H21DRAFT_826351 [Amylocystis lapponica]|nr:hypothetical protein B0H21DRAFT_826351 [Amylocystis lapponica]
MAKSNWTKEQNKLIHQARPAWNAAEDQPKRTEILEELGKAMGVLTGTPLTKAQLKAVQKNLRNHQPKKEKKAKLDYMRNKTWRHVVQEKYKARIDNICKDLSRGDHPGGQKWLGVYQKAVSQVCDGVTEAEKDELKAEANRQNREGFLPEEQRKLVVKEGDKIVKKFAEDVFKMLGMRVWVLGAFQAVNGKVNVSCFDNNDSIGNGDLVTDVIKEWDENSYVELWRRYAATQFLPEQDAGDDSDDDLPKRKKKLPRPEMDLDDEGLPIIPAGTDERVKSLPDKKAIIAKFLSMHYVLCCGKANAKVPWAAIQASPKDYIESSHVPRRFVLKEPTKMVQDDVDALLAHWRERQADDNCEVTFRFKAYKGSDNRPRPPVERAYDEDSEEDEGEGKGKERQRQWGQGEGRARRKRKGKGNGKDGSSDEEEEEEDDLDEELEAEDESEVEALTNAVTITCAVVSHESPPPPKDVPLHIRSPPLPPSGKKAAEVHTSWACLNPRYTRHVFDPSSRCRQSASQTERPYNGSGDLEWVNANPTMNRYNEMHVSKAKLELIALTVGMVIHDIEASQFATGDPDEEPEDGSIPPYITKQIAELTRTPPPPHRVTRKTTGSLKPKRWPDAAKEDDEMSCRLPPKDKQEESTPS